MLKGILIPQKIIKKVSTHEKRGYIPSHVVDLASSLPT
jgi:hypothetical protein